MASPKLFSYKGLRLSSSVRRTIKRHPELDEVTEQSLLLAAQSGDIESRQTLINHHLAFVCKVGGVYRKEQPKHLLLDDYVLFNQGILGLNHAIDEWSPDGGARLSTFAYWHVRKAMQSDDSLYADNTIRIPESARDQLKTINEVIEKHEGPLTTEEIAERTQLKAKRVETLLQIHQPTSLNVLENNSQTELVDRIADPDTEVISDMQEMLSAIPLEFAAAIQEQRWGDLLKLIPSTLAEVIRLHFLEGATFKAISKKLAIPLHKVGAVVREGIEALRLELLGPEVVPSPPQPVIEPIGDGDQLSLEFPIPEIVETGRKLLTRGVGFGVQVVKQVKRAAKKIAEVLSNPLKVFAQPQTLQPESTTNSATPLIDSADLPSVSPSIASFESTHNNIVDFEHGHSRGVVSLDFYTQKVFDSGGVHA